MALEGQSLARFPVSSRVLYPIKLRFDGGYNVADLDSDDEDFDDEEEEGMQAQIETTGTGRTPIKPAVKPPKPEDKPLAEGETELKFNISQNSRARIVFSGQVTQEAIELLAKMLDLQKLTFPKEVSLPQQSASTDLDEDGVEQ